MSIIAGASAAMQVDDQEAGPSGLQSPVQGNRAAKKRRGDTPDPPSVQRARTPDKKVYQPVGQLVLKDRDTPATKENVLIGSTWMPQFDLPYRQIGHDEFINFYTSYYNFILQQHYKTQQAVVAPMLTLTEWLLACKYGQYQRLCVQYRSFVYRPSIEWCPPPDRTVLYPKVITTLWDGLGRVKMNGGTQTYYPMPTPDPGNDGIPKRFDTIRFRFINWMNVLEQDKFTQLTTISNAVTGTAWWTMNAFCGAEQATMLSNNVRLYSLFTDPTPVDRLHARIVCGTGQNLQWKNFTSHNFDTNPVLVEYVDSLRTRTPEYDDVVRERFDFFMTKNLC